MNSYGLHTGIGYCASPLNCDEIYALPRSMDAVGLLTLCECNSEFVGDSPLSKQEADDPGDSQERELNKCRWFRGRWQKCWRRIRIGS